MTEFVPFSLEIEYSDDDVVRLAAYLQNRSVLFRYSWFFIPASVAMIIFMVILSMSSPTDQINYPSVAILSLGPALLLGLAILISKRLVDPWFLDRRIRKLNAVVPGFENATSYNFTLEHVESSNTLVFSRANWRSFSRITENEDAFLFWSGSILSVFIPKRSVANSEMVERLRSLARDKGLLIQA